MNVLRYKIIGITQIGWTLSTLIRDTHHIAVRVGLGDTYINTCSMGGNEVFTLLTLTKDNYCHFYSPTSINRHPWRPL